MFIALKHEIVVLKSETKYYPSFVSDLDAEEGGAADAKAVLHSLADQNPPFGGRICPVFDTQICASIKDW